MTKVAIALIEVLVASRALDAFGRCAHAAVHGTIRCDSSGIIASRDRVIYIAAGYFEDGLLDNLVVGPGGAVRGVVVKWGSSADRMPKCSSPTCLGTRSTTWALTRALTLPALILAW